MDGIMPYIDLHATLAMVNKKQSKKTDENLKGDEKEAAPQHEQEGDEDEECSDICKPCLLEPARLRTLNTIIAGSIRPPHRLMHAKVKVMENDKCTHPLPGGAE